LNTIFLVGLWYAHHVKTYGYDKLLRPAVNCLKQLETDSGMTVDVIGTPSIIRGILALFSADNLGLHSFFGFLESFSAKKFCHICECTKAEAQVNFTEAQFLLRTKESYNKTVVLIEDPLYNQSETGIRRGCILNELKYFLVVENYCVGAMHDLLEGIIPLEFSLVLTTLVSEKYLTVDNLNAAIASFDYSAGDKNSKPSTFSLLSSIHLNATEALCFIRNLPLMIGSQIPQEEPHWKLLLMLLDILDSVFAPEINKNLSSYLSHLIAENHSHFKNMYPENRLLPKHHFLIHYPACLLRCGPSTGYWCMRFEARHSFFKQIARVIHCFKTYASR